MLGLHLTPFQDAFERSDALLPAVIQCVWKELKSFCTLWVPAKTNAGTADPYETPVSFVPPFGLEGTARGECCCAISALCHPCGGSHAPRYIPINR